MTQLNTAFDGLAASPRMPALFIGHGNPMNAIEDNDYSRTWRSVGDSLPMPSAILCVSAHWMTRGTTLVNVSAKPETIHDFGGFPRQLFEQHYPAPGAPVTAAATVELLRDHHVEASEEWGLDHGAWSVLIIGSGNVVHNLMALNPGGAPYDWAQAFDAFIAEKLDARDFKAIVNAGSLGRVTKLAHPTAEHFLPMVYSLGVAGADEKLTSFNASFDMASISMRSFMLS